MSAVALGAVSKLKKAERLFEAIRKFPARAVEIGGGLRKLADKVGGKFGETLHKALGWAERKAARGAVPRVHMGKQGKHIPGHNNFQQGRSVLRADPHELARRAGTGTPANNVARGQPGFRERVQFDEVIGDFVKDGVATPTRNAIIHYSKDGIHIVPAAP